MYLNENRHNNELFNFHCPLCIVDIPVYSWFQCIEIAVLFVVYALLSLFCLVLRRLAAGGFNPDAVGDITRVSML